MKQKNLERKIENHLTTLEHLAEVLRPNEIKSLYHSINSFEHDVVHYTLHYAHHKENKTDDYINRLKKIMGE